LVTNAWRAAAKTGQRFVDQPDPYRLRDVDGLAPAGR
jgi:hypothetical protein